MTPTSRPATAASTADRTDTAITNDDPRTPAALRDPARLRSVAGLDLGDPELRARLDRIADQTRLALGAEVGLVTLLLDTAQAVVASSGLSGWVAEVGGTPAEWAFCSQLVRTGGDSTGGTYMVESATEDPLHRDNPLVVTDGFRCYLGAPLVDAEGRVLGGHCVLGTEPRRFGAAEAAVLGAAAAQISALLDGHRRVPVA